MTIIRVRSNVRRDLLQSAQLFKNEKLVIWEYVSNSLQYVEPGVTPQVEVLIDTRQHTISIQDNGRGMDQKGLQNFFVMHGENLDRLAGRRGRGRFGTGKSAAFGIARSLKVTSVRNGRRSTVLLTRDAIDIAGDDEIPLTVLEAEVPVSEANGTRIVIEDVQLRRLDQMAVVRYIERHLSRWSGRPIVIVNSHECEPQEPPISQTKLCHPDPDTMVTLGNAPLLLKVSSIPLETDQQGVAVFASGVWLASTLAGLDGQSMSNYIFGEIDVPALDNESDPIPAFDMTRSMQLNPENPTVQTLLSFLGREIDQLRRELVREERERRAEEDAKKLQREADLIADLINADFREFSDRLQRVTARSGRGRDRKPAVEPNELNDFLIPTPDGPSTGDQTKSEATGSGRAQDGGSTPDPTSLLTPSEAGKDRGKAGSATPRRKASGGFRVEFKSLGEQEFRARYVREERVIFVNLDHPQIRAARGGESIDSVTFRRVAYEVAFCEYAIALASELAASQEYMDPTDPIIEIRETMNRMAVSSAKLYAPS